jgi:hypothetical protein
MTHPLTFRHDGPLGTALCLGCGSYVRGEDLPHGIVDLATMLDYLDLQEQAKRRGNAE